ncbi:YbbC/YhhH family protein [Serratia nevei]|uniref:NTF2 fold immunity protein n=1 Tax=Serratia nevei TaxID=2703794 RepID=UPI00209EE7BD|nr:NTF2 fold immunity protein [Serratia nevei]MCP1106291.1 YbbC/YhhH family protein [Serratia nevei]
MKKILYFLMVVIMTLSGSAFSKGYVPKDGFVPTEEIAREIGLIIASEVYGRKRIEEQIPLLVELDGDKWIIRGSRGKSTYGKGGLLEMHISKKSGEVLFMLHGK